jgi:hypothetical protein
MPAFLIRTSRGPYRRRGTRSAPAASLPSSVTSIRTYPAPSPSEATCPAAASRAAEQGGMAGDEKRAGRLAAEPLLAPVIRVTRAEATSYSMTPRSPGGTPTGPASTGGPRRSSSRTPLPTACPLVASTPSSAARARPPRSPSGFRSKPRTLSARTSAIRRSSCSVSRCGQSRAQSCPLSHARSQLTPPARYPGWPDGSASPITPMSSPGLPTPWSARPRSRSRSASGGAAADKRGVPSPALTIQSTLNRPRPGSSAHGLARDQGQRNALPDRLLLVAPKITQRSMKDPIGTGRARQG